MWGWLSDIEVGKSVVGVYIDDDSTVKVEARGDVPLGHKIAARPALELDEKEVILDKALDKIVDLFH
jgi:hypothetical protein